MKVHRCAEKWCYKFISTSKRYCDEHAKLHEWQRSKEEIKEHQKKYNAESRNQEANQFYQSRAWKKTRNYVINRDMNMCAVCKNAVTDRKIVDHVHALKFSEEEKLDTENLWTLCYRCHSIKTKLEQQIAEKQNGNNVLKHMNKETWIKYIKERLK